MPRRPTVLAFVLLTLAAWLGLGVGAPLRAAPPEPLGVAWVTPRSPDAIQRLADAGYDIWTVDRARGRALIALSAAQARTLAAQGMVVEEAPEQAAALAQGPLAFFQGYQTVEELYALADALAASHPPLVQVVDYGDSWQKSAPGDDPGYDLRVLRLTNRAISGSVAAPGWAERPDIQISKPVFFLMADIHARELSTAETARRLVRHLVEGYGHDADATWLLDHHEVWIVLTANPDGYQRVASGGDSPISQRKNMNPTYGSPCFGGQVGVDLNRNASFKWGGAGTSPSPCSLTYLGPAPASEPEQQALEALMAGLFADQRGPNDGDAAPASATGVMISLHSFSDLVLWPWGWSTLDAPNDSGLAQLGRKMARYNGYTAGQPGEVLYNASGTTDDWAYGTLGVAAFTFEIGPPEGPCGGFFPPYECQEDFWALNMPALLYAAKSARSPYLTPAGPDVRDLALHDSPDGSQVTLTATVSDAHNGGQPLMGASLWIEQPDWVAGSQAIPLAASDGAFDEVIEEVTVTLAASALGAARPLLFVRGQDAGGAWGVPSAIFGGHRLHLPLVGR